MKIVGIEFRVYGLAWPYVEPFSPHNEGLERAFDSEAYMEKGLGRGDLVFAYSLGGNLVHLG